MPLTRPQRIWLAAAACAAVAAGTTVAVLASQTTTPQPDQTSPVVTLTQQPATPSSPSTTTTTPPATPTPAAAPTTPAAATNPPPAALPGFTPGALPENHLLGDRELPEQTGSGDSAESARTVPFSSETKSAMTQRAEHVVTEWLTYSSDETPADRAARLAPILDPQTVATQPLLSVPDYRAEVSSNLPTKVVVHSVKAYQTVSEPELFKAGWLSYLADVDYYQELGWPGSASVCSYPLTEQVLLPFTFTPDGSEFALDTTRLPRIIEPEWNQCFYND